MIGKIITIKDLGVFKILSFNNYEYKVECVENFYQFAPGWTHVITIENFKNAVVDGTITSELLEEIKAELL